MARRRTRYSSRSSYRPRRSYGRPVARRRTRRRATRRTAPRIVIQVVGGPSGAVAASPLAIGMKGSRPVRARY